jgi:hypothetical protein
LHGATVGRGLFGLVWLKLVAKKALKTPDDVIAGDAKGGIHVGLTLNGCFCTVGAVPPQTNGPPVLHAPIATTGNNASITAQLNVFVFICLPLIII